MISLLNCTIWDVEYTYNHICFTCVCFILTSCARVLTKIQKSENKDYPLATNTKRIASSVCLLQYSTFSWLFTTIQRLHIAVRASGKCTPAVCHLCKTGYSVSLESDKALSADDVMDSIFSDEEAHIPGEFWAIWGSNSLLSIYYIVPQALFVEHSSNLHIHVETHVTTVYLSCKYETWPKGRSTSKPSFKKLICFYNRTIILLQSFFIYYWITSSLPYTTTKLANSCPTILYHTIGNPLPTVSTIVMANPLPYYTLSYHWTAPLHVYLSFLCWVAATHQDTLFNWPCRPNCSLYGHLLC